MSFVNFMTRHPWIGAFSLCILGLTTGIFGIRYFISIASWFGAILVFMSFMTLATLWQRVIYSARDQPESWNASASFLISVLMAIALAMSAW